MEHQLKPEHQKYLSMQYNPDLPDDASYEEMCLIRILALLHNPWAIVRFRTSYNRPNATIDDAIDHYEEYMRLDKLEKLNNCK